MHRTPWLPSVTRRRVAVAFAGPLFFLLLLPWCLPDGELRNDRFAGSVAPAPAVALEEATPDATVPAIVSDPQAQRVQHLAQLGVLRWHGAGYRGRGVKVAILDSGFRGYRDHLGHALPGHVPVRSFRADRTPEAKDRPDGIL